jgi:cytochrome c-type biogenesis protein CcmH
MRGQANQGRCPWTPPKGRALWKPVTGALLLALLAAPAFAISDPAEMLPDPAQEARAEAIGSQLRCLVCQNESIEDSGADLARDLRSIVRQRVRAGDSDQQVIDWMVGRYGNFVRLRPPLNASTLLLWGSPVLALLAGGAAVLLARRNRPAPPAPLTEAERARLAELSNPR